MNFNPAEIVFGTDDTGHPVYIIKYDEELVYVLNHYNDRYTGDRDIYIGHQGPIFRVVEDKVFVSPNHFKQFMTNHTENLEQSIPYRITLDHWYEVKSLGSGGVKTVTNASLEFALKNRFKSFSILRATLYKTISPLFDFNAPHCFLRANDDGVQVGKITAEEADEVYRILGVDAPVSKMIRGALLQSAKERRVKYE